jgi:2-succinyl-5-enolpyruvyl-6-hydroxy-3-cyclohexene-1-carboxylate synthase
MPRRDIEWFGGGLEVWGPVVSNRGVTGIDGVTATAVGAALGADGPVVALRGDLALLHDLSALVEQLDGASSLTVVVVDTGGGGIFSFLPQAMSLELAAFEEFFGTPCPVDVVAHVTALGPQASAPSSIAELDAALDEAMSHVGITMLRCVVGDRAQHVAHHEELVAAATAAVASVLD